MLTATFKKKKKNTDSTTTRQLENKKVGNSLVNQMILHMKNMINAYIYLFRTEYLSWNSNYHTVLHYYDNSVENWCIKGFI